MSLATPPVPTTVPPREPSRAPRLKLPAGACDTHCHVFGPWRCFPYVDPRPYTPHDVPKEKIFALHRHLGIDRGVLVQGSPHGTDHAAMLDLIAAGQGNYRGVCMVDEATTEDDLRIHNEGGVRAVRFHAVPHLAPMPSPEFLKDIARRIRPLDWHIVLHLMPDTLDLVDRFLGFDLPIVIDHMARIDPAAGMDQPALAKLLKLLRDDRFWIKLGCADRVSRTGPPSYADTVPLAKALVEAAPDRAIWSTDYPHVNVAQVADDADLVDLLGEVIPDPAVLKKVLVDNPHRLYRFG